MKAALLVAVLYWSVSGLPVWLLVWAVPSLVWVAPSLVWVMVAQLEPVSRHHMAPKYLHD